MKNFSIILVLLIFCSFGAKAQKVSAYPVATSVATGDLFDLTKWLGGSSYQSQSLNYSLLLSTLNTDITNIYNASGTLTANRTVTQAGFDLRFTGGNIGIGLAPNNSLQVLDLLNFDVTANDNLFIGYKAGDVTSTKGNTFVGSQAGIVNSTGSSNTFVGAKAGFSVTTGVQCTFVGGVSGSNNTADYSTFYGYASGVNNTSGSQNSLFGYSAGYYNQTGSQNAIFGYKAGFGTTGNSYSSNCFFGNMTGFAVTTGSNNVFIGDLAGTAITTGRDNVFIGTSAGSAYTTETDLFELSSSSNILITGNFSTGLVTIPGDLTVTGTIIGASSNYGEFKIEANANPTTVRGTAQYQALTGDIVTGLVNGFTYDAGQVGVIASVADAGGGDITVTDVAHGLVAGDMITITGTTDYNGLYEVKTAPTADTYTVTVAFVATNTGYWQQGASLTVGADAAGVYTGSWSSTGIAATNGHVFDFGPVVNTTVSESAVARRTFSNTDYGSFSGTGLITLTAGDVIYFVLRNNSATANITIRGLNLNLHRL